MNIFAHIRRFIWAVLLAACVAIGCGYLIFSQVFLSSQGLTHILEQSRLAETVKNETLLPKILANARSSSYAPLLDDTLVTNAFNATVTTEALNTKFAPAIDALQLWLNGKQPAIQFTISMADLSSNFAAKLAEGMGAKIDTLPQCTRQNTLADIKNLACRPPGITGQTFRAAIHTALKSDTALQETTTLHSEDIPQLTRFQSESNLPSYLSLLYIFTLITTGIAALISLWLLLKHRLAGIVTIGVACLFAMVVLLAAPIAFHAATAHITNPMQTKMIFAATTMLTANLQPYTLGLAITGVAAISLGLLGIFLLSRRKQPPQTTSPLPPPQPTPGGKDI